MNKIHRNSITGTLDYTVCTIMANAIYVSVFIILSAT